MIRCGRAAIVCALVLLVGCSSQTPTRFDLSGTVTFKGRPVPAGVVAINPDLSKGNDGPQGLAEIHNGRFDTRTLHNGAPSGPAVLIIDGFDGVPLPESPYGTPLFLGYKFKVELPKEASEQYIDVPESAGVKGKYTPVPPP